MEPVSPLKLLTHHAWDHVLAHLDNPTDRLNAANANLLFRQILKVDQQETWICMVFDMTLLDLLEYLKPTDLYKLRLVNKSFHKSVDDLLRYGISAFQMHGNLMD